MRLGISSVKCCRIAGSIRAHSCFKLFTREFIVLTSGSLLSLSPRNRLATQLSCNSLAYILNTILEWAGGGLERHLAYKLIPTCFQSFAAFSPLVFVISDLEKSIPSNWYISTDVAHIYHKQSLTITNSISIQLDSEFAIFQVITQYWFHILGHIINSSRQRVVIKWNGSHKLSLHRTPSLLW